MKKSIIDKLNITKPIATHLFGENHGHGHRMFVGTVIMIVGTSLETALALTGMPFEHYFSMLVGNTMHGFGLAPFIDWLISKKAEESKPDLCVDCKPLS